MLHGPNGAGKSTISEGVRGALWGEPGKSMTGTARKPGALWKPVEIHKSASTASIDVELVEASDKACRLSLHLEMTGGGSSISLTSSMTFDDGKGSTISIADRAAFEAALKSAPPVLAYADMANDLRETADLTAWLTESLGMGPRLLSLTSTVADGAAESATALRSLKSELEAAQRKADAVDAAAKTRGITPTVELKLEIFDSEAALETWLASNNLSERQKAKDVFSVTTDTTVAASAEKLLKAIKAFDLVSIDQSRLIGALLGLGAPARTIPEGDSELKDCPVCGTIDVDWRTHLLHLIDEQNEYNKLAKAVQSLAGTANSEIVQPMSRARDIVLLANSKQEGLSELSSALRAASIDLTPGSFSPSKLNGLKSLLSFIASTDGEGLRETAVSHSNEVHDWQCERWDVVAAYTVQWRSLYLAASEAALWKATQTAGSRLLQVFRDQRNKQLSLEIDSNVSAMLSEFGLKIERLRLTANDADFDLKDQNGQKVELGELSAGQRNALILAPMLATAESSMFGFTLLDDPVHAFDEIRVDHLAVALARIGKSQRLIVTTHDGRLVEQLRLHCGASFELFDISREPVAGEIRLQPRDDSATEILSTAANIIGSSKATMHSVAGDTADWTQVEILLRLAVDEALTLSFLKTCIGLTSSARRVHEEAFEKLDTLDQRFDYLMSSGLVGLAGASTLENIKTALTPFISRWNGALHNNSNMADLTLAEIVAQKDAAKRACREIANAA